MVNPDYSIAKHVGVGIAVVVAVSLAAFIAAVVL